MKKRTISIVIIAAAAVAAFMGRGQSQAQAPRQVASDTALGRNLTVFNTITRYLAETYVDSLRPDEAFEAAIGAMLNTIDPYTEYYTSDERENLEIMTTGSYGGIGAFVRGMNGDTYIAMPIEGSPSYKVGLRAGDRILRVDTTDVTGKPTDFTTKRLKGDPGTTVRVTVERPYVADSILSFDILREKVQDSSVPFYGVIDGDIGFVKLTSFQDKSAQEVHTALESFKANPDVKGLILDLRANGGGLVTTAVDILDMILPRGIQVLETKGKTPDSYKAYTTAHTPLLPDMPLVVLIDEGSASAAEITAGAVQDLDRGVLVGRRSFGKGLVQGTYSLPFDGLLKVTTAKYHLPSGRLIQALDYSRRNPDGSVAHTPDSLANEFKTKAGRTVRDGGGLTPDSIVSLPDYSTLIYNLVVENQIFNFATKYAATHPEIAPPGEFTIDDEIFAEFVEFVDTAKVKSDKAGEKLLEQLRKTAGNDGFMTPELDSAIDAMMPLVMPDLKRDLYNKRDEVAEFLGREIVSRYYNRSGEEEYSLRFDEEVSVARDILHNPDLYRQLLSPPPVKKSKRK